MFRLTLTANSEPQIHLYNQSTILIGSEGAHVDLVLPNPFIQPLHLKIVDQNDSPHLINQANDPFVTLNGKAFGKKRLHSGDLITIHDATLLFEVLPPTFEEIKKNESEDLLKPKPELVALSCEMHEMTKSPSLPSFSSHQKDQHPFSFPFENDVTPLSDDEIHQTTLETLLKDIPSSAPPSAPQASKTPSSSPRKIEEAKKGQNKKNVSLKDDYLRELDDENHDKENGPFGNLKESSHLYHAWKWILLFIFTLLTVSGTVGTVLYFLVSDKTEVQESKAAQGVADVAMALAHAQLNHLKPNNQNWSDVEFLKSNLQAILPDIPSFASRIDAQGQFHFCPYSLRIYTNRDLSHFLLIAQPAPSLLNWLIPQSLIVVDSQLMELRNLKDARSLNRLLTRPDPLEGQSSKEITDLIKQGKLISLTHLASESGNDDFSPPKHLAWARPGAENLIYNAPRYFRLGQPIIQKAIALSTSKGTSQEVAALKLGIENLSWLTHFTLYAEEGKKTAALAKQGLMLFAPSEQLLFGYLQLDAQGRIHQAHLLKDDEEGKKPPLSEQFTGADIIAFEPHIGIANPKNDNTKEAASLDIDTNHPIFIQLQSLVQSRDAELKPLALNLHVLVGKDLLAPRGKFQNEFQNLSHAYLMANAKHKQAIKESLDALYGQYQDIPIDQYIAFIKALNLEQMIQSGEEEFSIIDENCQQNIELLLTHIEKSKSMNELDNFIHIANTWLNFDYIKDPKELMKYQNQLRNRLLDQLEKFLLQDPARKIQIHGKLEKESTEEKQNKQTSQEISDKDVKVVEEKKNGSAEDISTEISIKTEERQLKSEDRETLLNILNQERLIKPEEKDYFLEEFEKHFKR